MRLYIDPADHAFASGPAFPRPRSLLAAIRQAGGLAPGRRLWAVWQQFERGARLGEDVRLGLGARLVNKDAPERVEIGSHAVIRGIVRNERGGTIHLGERVYLGDGSLLSAATSITIADGVLLAHGVEVFDNDSHPTDPLERENHFRMILGMGKFPPVTIGKAPVRIESRAWIGLGSLVMKGVTVGADTIVAAGSVVVKSLPAASVAGGNPARVLSSIHKKGERSHDQAA